MKATGIVRRIDDLGRVVIPKEIRRTLRIREGDPLEIFTDTDGMVIFKKYSQINELSDFATQYTEVLSKAADMPSLICDCDHVVAAAGIPRKEILGRRITPEAEEYLLSRAKFLSKPEQKNLCPVEGVEKPAGVICPIIASGDVSGAVILLREDPQKFPGEIENKLAQTAAAFLSRHLEV